MTLKLYMDVHVKRPVTNGLRRSGVDVLTAQEYGSAQWNDSDLLDHATSLGRILFSQDNDLLREATRRQRTGHAFAGVIYAHQLNITVGQALHDLIMVAEVYDPDDMKNRVEYLPL